MFKRYRHHRLQTPCGVSCLVSARFYTCITLEGSVAPSHSFHRETSHLLKATPSSVFECKSKKTIHFSFLLRASYKLLRQRAKWSTQKLDLLIVSLKHNLHFSCAKKKKKKKVRAYWWLTVARLVEDFALKFVLMCPQFNKKKKNFKSIKFIHQLLEKVFNKTKGIFVLGKLCQVMELPRAS